MAFDPDRYVHPSDLSALKALKAIPGFSMLTKGFLNVWNERQERILNMSSRIKLGGGQMDVYYNMLPPICDQLGIPVPDLYLEMNVVPNAYTYGDTAPFIVLTSGLLNTLPEELIPTILAHECGHIACHHVLYRTMGRTVLNGAAGALSYFLKLGGLLTVPLQVAFYYWMRCSEFSADRAAVLCDGAPEKMQEVCMRLAGWDKGISAQADIDLFLRQAEEYKDMINGSAWNKTLEFLILSGASHPLMAVRATECAAWAGSDAYYRIMYGLPAPEQPKPANALNLKNLIAQTVDQKESGTEQKKVDPLEFLNFLRPKKTDKTDGDASVFAPDDISADNGESVYQELQWYKRMLDEGLLTQEEFEQKKRDLLK